jgi:hypothetical protein
MSRWYILSRGSYVWSVPKSHWTPPAARTGTAGTLQRLEPAPMDLKTDRCNALVDNRSIGLYSYLNLVETLRFGVWWNHKNHGLEVDLKDRRL